MLERHNGVTLEKSKKTASSLCRDAARVLVTSPVPAFPVQPTTASHSIPRSSSPPGWLRLFTGPWNWLYVILLLAPQCLDKHPFPGVSAPLNLVESLACMPVGLSFQAVLNLDSQGTVGTWVQGNLPKLEEVRASHRERHRSF